MIIHGPQNADYDEDVGPIFLTDYYHKDHFTIVEEVMGTDLSTIVPASGNKLINGKGTFDCFTLADNSICTANAGVSKFQFKLGNSFRLRLINGGVEPIQLFSIDYHTLSVVAHDLTPIEPYTTDVVTLGVGQRADVIVTATGSSTDSVWMRSTIGSYRSLSNQPEGLAIIYHENANSTA